MLLTSDRCYMRIGIVPRRSAVGASRPLPSAPADRLLSEPTEDTQSCWRESLFISHSSHSAAVLAAIPPRVQSCRSFPPVVARGVTTADIGRLFDHLVGDRKQLVGHRRQSASAAFKLTVGAASDLAFYDRLFGECTRSVLPGAGPGSPHCDGRGAVFSECPPVGTASAVISAADSRPSPGVPRGLHSRT